MSGIANGIVVFAASTVPLSPRQSAAIFRAILGRTVVAIG